MSAPGDAALSFYEDVGLRMPPAGAALSFYEDVGYRYPPDDAALSFYEELPPLIIVQVPDEAMTAEVRSEVRLQPRLHIPREHA